MGLLLEKEAYPLLKVFHVLSQGTTSIDLMRIPAGCIIEQVYVRIKTAGVGTGNIEVGDDDDQDGFIAGGDATAAAQTAYGDDPTELGVYLYDGTKKKLPGKYYSAEGKELKAVIDAATLTTEVYFDVIVKGTVFAVS